MEQGVVASVTSQSELIHRRVRLVIINRTHHHLVHVYIHTYVQLECAASCWECLRNLGHNRMRYVAAFRAHRESQVRYLCIQARGCRIHVRIR